jgi:hypothetical protein
MSMSRRAVLATALLSLVSVVVACGGSTSSPSTGPSDAPAPASVAPPAASPSAPAVAIPSFDVSALLENLGGVDSYRVAISIGGEAHYSGVVVTRPVLSRDVTISQGDSQTRLVVIGDEAWMGTGDVLQPVPDDMAGGLLSAFDPTLLVGAFTAPGAMAGLDEVGTEEKNGVSAHHYRIEAGTGVGALASMPPGSAVDLWVADEGYLVSMAMSGLADEGDVTIDVSDVNDPGNVVERPD